MSKLKEIIKEEIQKFNEATDRGQKIIHTLKTKAISNSTGNKVYKYDVNILEDRYDNKKDAFDGMTLSIKSTPGNWYLSTLLGKSSFGNDTSKWDKISINGDWMCENWQSVIREAIAWLKKKGYKV